MLYLPFKNKTNSIRPSLYLIQLLLYHSRIVQWILQSVSEDGADSFQSGGDVGLGHLRGVNLKQVRLCGFDVRHRCHHALPQGEEIMNTIGSKLPYLQERQIRNKNVFFKIICRVESSEWGGRVVKDYGDCLSARHLTIVASLQQEVELKNVRLRAQI